MYYYGSMNDPVRRYLRYGMLGLVFAVVFGLSIWGGYQLTLKQTPQNKTSNVANRAVGEPVQEVLETVSKDTQVVNVDSLPNIYFQYAYSLTEEIWFRVHDLRNMSHKVGFS